MKSLPLLALAAWVLLAANVCGEEHAAKLEIPNAKAWVGERLPFFVKLRARGSFSGAASFSIPEVPRTVIIKIGSPVVSSEEIEGESWFVQTHEFALFTQQSGAVEIPALEVRFSHREGFVGPIFDKVAKTEPHTVTILRPEDSKDDTFLVTTESLNLSESWDHKPGTTEPGSVFHRTIVQEAQQITGMALAPPSLKVPEGIRVYSAPPEVVDQTERGDFIGKRSDTITYVMRKPGTWTLPAVAYVWWDPKREQFGSQTFPEVSFDVTAPQLAAKEPLQQKNQSVTPWLLFFLLLVIGSLAVCCQNRIVGWLNSLWRRWNPPDRVAARKLLNACLHNDPHAAEAAWSAWRLTQQSDFEPDSNLKTAVLEMQRHLFGFNAKGHWNGEKMAVAFRSHLVDGTIHPAKQPALPPLNS